jgi:uncharacterized protein (DUF362 family)
MKSKIALAKSNNRSRNIDTALRLIESEIDLEGKQDLFIKVNFVSTRNQLAATHVDAIRPLLKFLRERYAGKITIGESTFGSASVGYETYGYLDLVKEFGVELVDLNKGEWELVELYDSGLRPIKLHFARQVITSDYRIVIGPAKTHDTVGVTLSIKNLAMGGLSYPHGDKRKMHQGYPVHNLNLYLLAKAYPPHLSIIDGFIGMEGNGPIFGTPVEWGVAIISCDPVAADCLTAQMIGFEVSDIGYLWYCKRKGLGVGNIHDMEILGVNPKDCYRRFQPHTTYEEQKRWRDERINRILEM